MDNTVKFDVYQIKNIGDCNYAFMGYDNAEGKINRDDYQLVVQGEEYKYDNVYTILENIFREGNNGNLQRTETLLAPMRSISVSDVIGIDGKYYYIDSFGFKEISF